MIEIENKILLLSIIILKVIELINFIKYFRKRRYSETLRQGSYEIIGLHIIEIILLFFISNNLWIILVSLKIWSLNRTYFIMRKLKLLQDSIIWSSIIALPLGISLSFFIFKFSEYNSIILKYILIGIIILYVIIGLKSYYKIIKTFNTLFSKVDINFLRKLKIYYFVIIPYIILWIYNQNSILIIFLIIIILIDSLYIILFSKNNRGENK